MQTKPTMPASASTSNVIPFPAARVRRAPARPLWASTGLYDPDMMADYWQHVEENFG